MVKKQVFIFIAIFALLSGTLTAKDQSEILKRKISTSFVDTPLEKVIRVLARQYQLNMVISGKAKERITTNLHDVTLGEGLDAILKSLGYHYILNSGLIIVKPLAMAMNGELDRRIYKLHYVDGFHLKQSIAPLLSSKGKMEAMLAEREKDIKEQRSNILVVTDYRENLLTIDQVVDEMDKPEKILQIEIRLIEKLIGDESRVGLDLPTSLQVQATGAETTAPITQESSGSGGQAAKLSAWYELPANVQNLNLGVLTFNDLKFALELLGKEANSRLVSKPSVTTMNNKKAVIQIGQTIPVPEVSRGIGGDMISYKEKDVSMRLEVIPHIGRNNDITLELHPILEEIIGYTGPAESQQPITSKREVETTVLINDGETVVIGGLVKETETKNVKKVWLLGDIPVLGYLFKHTVQVKQRSDLLIFITTKIFDPKDKKGSKASFDK